MPFRSEAQRKFLYAREPEVAEKFAEETPMSAYKKLPERLGNVEAKDKNRLKEYSKKHRRKKNG